MLPNWLLTFKLMNMNILISVRTLYWLKNNKTNKTAHVLHVFRIFRIIFMNLQSKLNLFSFTSWTKTTPFQKSREVTSKRRCVSPEGPYRITTFENTKCSRKRYNSLAASARISVSRRHLADLRLLVELRAIRPTSKTIPKTIYTVRCVELWSSLSMNFIFLYLFTVRFTYSSVSLLTVKLICYMIVLEYNKQFV